MKNLFRFFGIITLAAIIIFSMSACDELFFGASQDDLTGTNTSKGDENENGGDNNGNVWSDMTWTAVTDSKFPNGSSDYIRAIAYGGDKFVAGGSNGRMAYSYDGITWTAVENSTFAGDIYSIDYGHGLFVAVGYNAWVAYSYDGITWSGGNGFSLFGSNGPIPCVTHNESMFLAASGDGTIAVWPEGEGWKRTASFLFYGDGTEDITYGAGKFILVGGSGKMSASSDGTNWTTVTNNTFSKDQYGNIHSIAYVGGKFIAGGVKRMVYSSDGEIWITVPDSSFRNYGVRGIAYGNGTFVAGGDFGKIETSTDGISWKAVRDSKFPLLSGTDLPVTIYSIAYGGGRFVAVGHKGSMSYSN